MKRKSVKLLSFVCSLLLIGLSFSPLILKSDLAVSANADFENEKIVIIDAGHGGLTNTIKV